MTQIRTDLIKCESELHGWVSRMACSILSPIGNYVLVTYPSPRMVTVTVPARTGHRDRDRYESR